MYEYGKIISFMQTQLGETYEEAVEDLAKGLFSMASEEVLERFVLSREVIYHDPDGNRDCYMQECSCWGELATLEKE